MITVGWCVRWYRDTEWGNDWLGLTRRGTVCWSSKTGRTIFATKAEARKYDTNPMRKVVRILIPGLFRKT